MLLLLLSELLVNKINCHCFICMSVCVCVHVCVCIYNNVYVKYNKLFIPEEVNNI